MPTMGDVLREARYRLNVPLEEVEAYTKVRKKYLIALEEDNYAELPAPVYARGFVQLYAEFLGIDPQFVDKLYQPPREVVPRVEIRPAASGISASAGISMRMLGSFFLAIVGLAAIVFLYWQYATYISSNGLAQSGSNPVLVTPTRYVPAVLPTPTATAVPTPSPTPVQGVEVTVSITERCWTRVVLDGSSTPVFEGELQPGDTRTWKANDRIDMRVGNAGGVYVTVNGMQQGKLGANGEVKNVTWGRQ